MAGREPRYSREMTADRCVNQTRKDPPDEFAYWLPYDGLDELMKREAIRGRGNFQQLLNKVNRLQDEAELFLEYPLEGTLDESLPLMGGMGE